MPKRRDQIVEEMLPDFFHRQAADAAWGHACSMIKARPGLRGFWPMSSVDYTAGNRAVDISGQGNHLGDAGAGANVEFSYDTNSPLAPIAIFNGGANDYLSRADGGAGNWADILGTEGYIRAAERGLVLEGWFWWSAIPGPAQYLMAKDDRGANRQYALFVQGANDVRFIVNPGLVNVTSSNFVVVGWNHVIGIYDQANLDLHVVLNGTLTSNVGGAPAALTDTTAPFVVGADSAGGNLFTGYASMCSLGASSVPLALAYRSYELSAPLFGLKPQVVG
jgi:hypothetical protein